MKPVEIKEYHIAVTYFAAIPKETKNKTSAYRLGKIIQKAQAGIDRAIGLALQGRMVLLHGHQTVEILSHQWVEARIDDGQIQVLVEYSPGKAKFVTVEPTLSTTYKLYI